ncbi:hypothetical protein Pla175_30320 [Pirellulimonas nuda]|uniref:Carboxypeptidase regulatory-like domain-containing protein n=1 Tax=Pirellulimonas nuda TaxID=2528009 RepID=A0A518DDT2_9BACT|nr:carboxypeptidase-like regulatory domain-containing protein [Pirellulimonas nuda]QDU89639.1 hypothetical protein Pla175_30320 [Pirellulimonas nuda]
MRAGAVVVVAVVAVSHLVGCRGGEQLVQAAGRVQLDGKPLAEAQVVFYPLEGEGRRAFIGMTDAQGGYELSEAGGRAQGVPPGKYRVSISTAVQTGVVNEFTPTPPERVPKKYANGALEFEVPPTGAPEAHFDLES